MNEEKVRKILQLLEEYYEKESPYFVTSGELRAKTGLTVEEMRPFAEALSENGYGQVITSFSNGFTIRLNDRGHKAFVK